MSAPRRPLQFAADVATGLAAPLPGSTARRWRRGWVPRATMMVFEVQSQSRPSLAEADGGYEVLGGDRVGCGVID